MDNRYVPFLCYLASVRKCGIKGRAYHQLGKNEQKQRSPEILACYSQELMSGVSADSFSVCI